jgi:DNA-directed RNA polymerase specialized sigma24 family protein
MGPDYPWRECAQILGIPAATVKTRMFYARKKLASWSTKLSNMKFAML